MNGEEESNPQSYAYHRIDADTVDLDAVTFHITTSLDKRPLEESLAHAGLLTPPILLPVNNRFHVVCGFRRVAACRALGWKKLPALILPAWTERVTCTILAIADNALQRSLNLVEQARAVGLLSEVLDENGVATWAQRLGLPLHRKMHMKLKRLIALPEPILDGVVEGLFTLSTAMALAEMSQPNQLAVAKFFTTIGPSASLQREMLVLIQEIATRDGMTIGELLRAPEITGVVFDLDIDRNQRAKAVRQVLQRKRFPRLSTDLERYHLAKTALDLGDKVQISHPPDFEGDIYTMSIRFKNRADMREALSRIAAALEQDSFDGLFMVNRAYRRR